MQLTLRNISSVIELMGKSFNSFDFGGLQLDALNSDLRRPKEIDEELNIPVTADAINVVALLNPEQKHAYTVIYNRIVSGESGAFFLDGLGDTGKTFLYSALLANLRSRGVIAVAVATSGITASNMAGGRTTNSRFKIPLDIEETHSSQISKQSSLAALIRACKLVIWDIASMARRQYIEHFERTMRDICSNDNLFGGKVVVFSGDFRQVLLVIPKSSLREALNASFVMSPLRHKHEKLHLTINMCAIHDPTFSRFVLHVGDGRPPYVNGKYIKLPGPLVISDSDSSALVHCLIDIIYPHIQLSSCDPLLTTKHEILTQKNEDT